MHDVFKFRFEPVEKPFTKRGLLSTVSALFDPLGLIAPVCLPAKQLLQNLCKSHAGWDTPLSSNDLSLWMDWMRFMKNLGQISVPRSIKKEDKSEMSKIELHLFCDASESGYGELIKELREKGSCENEEGELQRLSPILVDGLVCVGGRLNYSDYPLTFKHPVILPRHHFVTELIIRHYHIIEGHTGTSQVLATLRRNYWIIKGISAVKRVIRKCIECRRLKAALGQQMMAPYRSVACRK
ncbi:unnamed protein product, partial [Heterobilharzia americana]